MRHVFIINPKAGRKDQTGRIYAMAEALRRKHGLTCDCLLTERPGGAEGLARRFAQSGEEVRLYACGGDGTAGETANGIAGFANAAMTCIPIGTGNDLLKNFGPEDLAKFSDAENLWDGPAFPLDLIDCSGRLCLTIACSGADAQVAERVHASGGARLLSGRGSYLAAVAEVFLFQEMGGHWTVTLDGVTQEDDFALAAVCNGRFYGGGSTPIPEARMTDGALDVILVRKVSRLMFARMFPAYSAGEHGKLPRDKVQVARAAELRIRSEAEIVTCLDGECSRSHGVTLRLSDKKVNFFGPARCDPDRTAK